MRKAEQLVINELVKGYVELVNAEIDEAQLVGKLRTCNAKVYETKSFYILKSYNTVVACIYKQTDTLVDFSRLVYGYTSTTAQHISKFEKDYCTGKWNCKERLQYREV